MEFTPEMLSRGKLPMYPKGSIVFFSKSNDDKAAIDSKGEDIIIGKIIDEYKLDGIQVYDIVPYSLRAKRFNETFGYIGIKENKLLKIVDNDEKKLFLIEENLYDYIPLMLKGD